MTLDGFQGDYFDVIKNWIEGQIWGELWRGGTFWSRISFLLSYLGHALCCDVNSWSDSYSNGSLTREQLRKKSIAKKYQVIHEVYL